MADSSFNLHSLFPQRGPLEGFQKAASDPAAFSAAYIWGIIFFGTAVFLWVLCQWVLVWWKTRRILKQLAGVTPENAAGQRERRQQPKQSNPASRHLAVMNLALEQETEAPLSEITKGFTA